MPDIAVGLVKMFNEDAVIDQQWYTNGNLWLFLGMNQILSYVSILTENF